jgi:hypothetical protein
MAVQLNPVDLGVAFEAQLESVIAPVPVYAAFNRNFATQPSFVTWMMRNLHQPVYTGQTQSNKGIAQPVFQISIFTQVIETGFQISDQILQSLHGYSGLLGGASGIWVAKVDVSWLYNSYDNDEKLAQIYLDCTIDIPT